MAGDWIKVEHATIDKPEVGYFAGLLGVSVDEALGILLRFWVWLDRNARNGCVTHVTRQSLDTIMHYPGFAAAIVTVKWAIIDESTCALSVPNFARHNEMSAKTRSSNAERQARYRAKQRNESNADSNVTSVTNPLPEKRREEVKALTTMSSSPENPANVDVTPLVINTANSARRDQAREVLAFLNAKTARNYRMVDANLGPIMARLKEGASVRDLRAVVARKCREWGTDERMVGYLRPATLFNATKFAQYIGEVPPAPESLDGAALS